MHTKQSLQNEAIRIIAMLQNDFLMDSGTFFLEKNPQQGEIFRHHIFPDLGDFLPFFLYFHETKFCTHQIEILKKILVGNMLVSEFPSFHLHGLVKTYEYSDLLLGLISYYSHIQKAESKKILEDVVITAISVFGLKKKIASFYYPKLHIRIPIIDTRDGTFIEIFTELDRALGTTMYTPIAKNIFETLTEIPFYKIHGLLPTFHAPWYVRFFLKNDQRFREAKIMKNNTNSLFGFLELYKKTKERKVLDVIYSMVDNIHTKATYEGGIAEYYIPGKKPIHANLTASFPMIDFLCDLYKETGREQDRVFAREIADFWLSKRGETGLFPLWSDQKDTFFDSETDMTIALYKLAEITKENLYTTAADQCFDAVDRYHAKQNFPLSVNIDTGEIRDATQRTKFIALYIKLLIAKLRMLEGDSVLHTKWLYELLKDR